MTDPGCARWNLVVSLKAMRRMSDEARRDAALAALQKYGGRFAAVKTQRDELYDRWLKASTADPLGRMIDGGRQVSGNVARSATARAPLADAGDTLDPIARCDRGRADAI